jgi:glycosyltransferase involved in cell wall biosynthesis
VGGLLYLVQDCRTGFHVPDGDELTLAKNLAYLLENDEIRREFGRHGASLARAYDWRAIAQQVLTLYESVLAGVSTAAASPSAVL